MLSKIPAKGSSVFSEGSVYSEWKRGRLTEDRIFNDLSKGECFQ